jgi:hypothetical protein
LSETEQLELTETWEDEDIPIDNEEHIDAEPPAPAETTGQRDSTLWKKWSMSGGVGRFLTVRPWLAASKVAIDIGETGAEGLKGHTLAWANTLSLTTYLEAVKNGRAKDLYPPEQGMPLEGYAYFGGAMMDNQPVSRILKIHYWPTGKDSFDDRAFIWKTGHFNARKSNTCAFIPMDMKSALSFHSIKVNRREMAELATAMNLAMINHASTTLGDDWLEQISGRRK